MKFWWWLLDLVFGPAGEEYESRTNGPEWRGPGAGWWS
jgi:hypothetical protein